VPIHAPKPLSTKVGLALPNAKRSIEELEVALAIQTEVWSDMPTSWSVGDFTIAQTGFIWKSRWEVGKPYVVTRIFDGGGVHIATYCDVTSPVVRMDDHYECNDLYLDVWVRTGQTPVILDEEELEEAREVGYLSSSDVTAVHLAAGQLIAMFACDSPDLIF
jgi:predicted RNA-binding protein associated with RNAse of E/G family